VKEKKEKKCQGCKSNQKSDYLYLNPSHIICNATPAKNIHTALGIASNIPTAPKAIAMEAGWRAIMLAFAVTKLIWARPPVFILQPLLENRPLHNNKKVFYRNMLCTHFHSVDLHLTTLSAPYSLRSVRSVKSFYTRLKVLNPIGRIMTVLCSLRNFAKKQSSQNYCIKCTAKDKIHHH
jgi:hypothetical protein